MKTSNVVSRAGVYAVYIVKNEDIKMGGTAIDFSPQWEEVYFFIPNTIIFVKNVMNSLEIS